MRAEPGTYLKGLAARLLAGDRRALAQAVSCLENGDAQARALLSLLYPHGGRAHTIGVTGSPGTGKSTLVNALAREYRKRGQTVGILAVDPSSPFTGGAILGDRLRMRDLSGDEGVFIRSLATRGATGGLSEAVADATQALDAAGYDRILIETVGAGQDEVEVARLAHTVIVIEAPGLGDEIQAIKAGILETADVLVVNKADRDGSEQTIAALRMMLDMAHPEPATVSHHGQAMVVSVAGEANDRWRVPLLATVAVQGRGVEEVLEAVEEHRAYLANTPRGAALARARADILLQRALDGALRRLLAESLDPNAYRAALEGVSSRTLDPHAAAELLVSQLRAAAQVQRPAGEKG